MNFFPPPGKANVHSGNPLEPSASSYSQVHFFTDVRQKEARQKGDKNEFLYGHVANYLLYTQHAVQYNTVAHNG